MIAVLASLLLASSLTPRELVENARAALPANAELSGRVILRDRKGFVQTQYDYVLKRTNGKTELNLDKEALEKTDVTWSDVTLDYLWWDDISVDKELDGETIFGQTCAVIVLKKGERTIRVWIDRKTGALMQAEELKNGEPIRKMWGTRIKKFGDRWMANVMEVETLGSGHRTKITVEELK